VEAAAKAAARQSAKKAAPAKRTVAKKAPARNAPAARKAPARKATSARKGVAKKAPAKRVTAKRTVAKKAPAKRVTAKRSVAKKAPAKRAEKKSTAGSRRRDDLKLISGVGPKLERMLNAQGIRTFEQVAAFTKADIARVDARLENFRGRIERDNWMRQARRLAAERDRRAKG